MFRDPFSTDLQTRTPPVRKPQAAYGSRDKPRFCKNWSMHGVHPLFWCIDIRGNRVSKRSNYA